jgi:hypothetical protein
VVPPHLIDTHGTAQLRRFADTRCNQAQKLKAADVEETEDELGEDSVLLESPLDRIDPYLAFRDCFKSKLHCFQ